MDVLGVQESHYLTPSSSTPGTNFLEDIRTQKFKQDYTAQK
jgi:hypothetical protein